MQKNNKFYISNIQKHFALLCFIAIAGISINSTNVYASSGILGCDPDVLERNGLIVDALDQVNAEIVRASISQPTPVEMLTCTDQQLEILNRSGNIHANPGGDIRESLLPYAQQPAMNQVTSFLNGASATVNSVSNAISNVFNNLFGSFSSSLGGLGAGQVPDTNCNVMEETWLLNQCLEMPEMPSLSSVLNGRVGEIISGLDNLNPDRYIEQICSAANSGLQGYFGDLGSVFDSAADATLDPITDSLP